MSEVSDFFDKVSGKVDPAKIATDLQGLSHPRASFAVMLAGLRSWALPQRSVHP